MYSLFSVYLVYNWVHEVEACGLCLKKNSDNFGNWHFYYTLSPPVYDLSGAAAVAQLARYTTIAS